MELDQFKDVYLVIDKANDSFVQKQFVSQGDYKGRTLTVQITNNGSVGEVPGLTLNLNWHNEASGLTDLTAFTVLDKTNSVFQIEYPEHMMTPGKVYANIQVIQDGKVTNLQQFELIVQKLAGKPVGIPEKAEFSALVAVLADSNKFRTDIDSLSASKADKSYINDYLSKVTVVPETFANLAAIQSEYPNGANGVMVAADNGHKYIWANNVWTDAGVYQSVGIADGTISLPMLDDQLRSNFVSISEYTPQLSGVGGVNVSGGKVTDFGTQSYWTHAQYSVAGKLSLYVSFGKSNNTAVTGHIFATDDNNTILASFVPGSGKIENLDNYAITTPAGTTKLFIQSFHNYQISVIGEMYKSLSASIDEKNTDLKQEIDNELKIYKEMNNSNVYNFISRQGMLGGYPENSNASVLNAKQNGFNYVRVSVAFTSDNVPVLVHDASINRVARNSDGSAISSTINIADITLEQANTYDWGIVAGQNHKGMKIPLLSDFLKICSFKSIFPTLEFKPSTATVEQLNIIISMVNQYGLANKTFFTSVIDSILLSVININPSINIGRITHLDSISRVDNVLKFKTEFNDVRIDMFDSDTPSVDVINYASSKGVGIKVGSAYSIADIVKFASMGVTDIEVANVAFPATALNEYYDNL